MKRIANIVASGLLMACASAPTVTPVLTIPFNADEVKWAAGTGSSVVEGQAFLKTRGGDVKYGAGEPVLLTPVTPQSTEWFAMRTTSRRSVPAMDPRLTELQRTTISSGDGRFKFENVPAGEWYVVTKVTWEVPSGGKYSYMQTQGGYLGQKISAASGQTTSVIVTQ